MALTAQFAILIPVYAILVYGIMQKKIPYIFTIVTVLIAITMLIQIFFVELNMVLIAICIVSSAVLIAALLYSYDTRLEQAIRKSGSRDLAHTVIDTMAPVIILSVLIILPAIKATGGFDSK